MTNYVLLKKLIVFVIPVTVLADWMFDFEWIDIQLGLYLKGLLTFTFMIFWIRGKKEYYFKNLFLYFLILFVVYSLFSQDVAANLYYSIRIAYWVFGSLIFYNLFRSYAFRERDLKTMLLLTVLVGSIFTIQIIRITQEYQNASAYLLLWCMPLLFYIKKSKLVQIFKVLAIVSILITIKRGAMISLALALIGYFFGMFYISRNYKGLSKVIFNSIVLFGVAMLAVYYNWDYISLRFSDTGGSGRDIMYAKIIENYFNGPMLNIIFGNGVNSVQRFTAYALAGDPNSVGVAAHSDWLQYMYDFGFFGIFFMIAFHVKFIKLIRVNMKYKTQVFPILFMAYLIFASSTIYSFILNTPNAIFLGIILALATSETKYFINNINSAKSQIYNE